MGQFPPWLNLAKTWADENPAIRYSRPRITLKAVLQWSQIARFDWAAKVVASNGKKKDDEGEDRWMMVAGERRPEERRSE